LVVGVAGPHVAQGADDPSGDFRAYALQHARAAEVESTLAPLLPPGAEVLVDSKSNRILVRGPALAHQIANQVIGSLDRAAPPPSAPSQSAGSASTLRVYACPPGQAKAVAAQLETDVRGVPGVRIVPDERTSQLLVVAPTEVQTRIAARLAEGIQAQPTMPAEAAAPQAAPSARAAAKPRAYQLSLMTADRLEAALAAILGDRLKPGPETSADAAVYRVALSDGSHLQATIHRRTNQVSASGPEVQAAAFIQLVEALDAPVGRADQSTRLIALRSTRPEDARRTAEAIRASTQGRGDASAREPLPAKLFQPRPRGAGDVSEVAQAAPAAPGTAPPGEAAKPGAPKESEAEEGGGMIGPVQVELLEGLDVLIVRGHKRDVQRVLEIIKQIEELGKITEPAIVVHPLYHVDSVALATLVNQIYTDVFAARQGSVSITALVKPNALLLVGRKESVGRVIELVNRLDVPVAPESQFQAFRLKHAAAATLQTTIQGFYTDRGGLGPLVRVTADTRSNTLVVQASPRDLAEVAALIARLDVPDSEKKSEIRIFRLNHAVAETLMPVLQDAIQAQAARPAGAAPTQAAGTQAGQAPGALEFLTVDVQGQRRMVTAGILADVRISADARANALIVSAPPESMPLIEALIKQLDMPPAVRAEIKVFTIVNGDAQALTAMLMDLFAQAATPAQAAAQSAAGEGESSLVPLRFVADARTNSIIAAGSRSDLLVAEAILLRLDESDVRNRKNVVYRLKNSPANDVANALSNFLRSEREVERIGVVSPFEQIEREVIVVAEPVTNSLIISATPRFYEEVMRLVEQLDQRPPMVMIQVLIAEVTLNRTDEFGVQLGLQDQLLFYRSPVTGTPAVPTPGFNFNNQGLGGANVRPDIVAPQGLSDLGMGRTNSQLGFGGLVLSASSESVSILLRALQERRKLEVLSRPQIMTLDNQPAYIQVGQQVPQIRGVSLTQFGQTNNIDYEDVGLILQVIPRISPDGLVVMEIDANRSSVGPESEGIPVSVSTTGGVIRAPRIDRTLAQTTVSALSGQTVILGGLISREKSEAHRQVPLLGDIPVVGRLFRFDSTATQRRELLIIMTPHIVKNEEDIERIKKAEAARMHWCLADVVDLHGDSGLRGRSDEWTDAETTTIYPDLTPGAGAVPVPPAPAAAPKVAPADALPKLEPTRSGPKDGATPASAGAQARMSSVTPAATERTAGVGPALESPRPTSPAEQANPASTPPQGAVEPAVYDLRGTAQTTVRYGPPPPRTIQSGNPLRGSP
jgi:type II secretion system protein D